MPSTVKVTAGAPPPHSGYSPFLFSVLAPILSRLKREDQRPGWPFSTEDTGLMTSRSLFPQGLLTRSGWHFEHDGKSLHRDKYSLFDSSSCSFSPWT